MSQKRPVAMLVFGILNLLFGTVVLGVFSCCGLLGGFSYLGVREAQKEMKDEEKAELEIVRELSTVITDNVPGLVPFTVASIAGGLFLAFLEIITGVGMVIIRSWGRWLCVLWAMLSVLGVLAWLFYWFTVFTPGVSKLGPDIERTLKKFETNQQKMGKAPPKRQDFNELTNINEALTGWTMIFLVVAGCYGAYAGLAFLFMIFPGTGEGIARYQGANGYQGASGDLYDDDYMRRRRDSGMPPEGTGPPGM